MTKLVLATHSAHKVREFNQILGEGVPGIEVISYGGPEPVEDGLSFEANALIKARAAAVHTGLPSLGDDSGICVDVLGGSPGIFSARWAGTAKDSDANLNLLLEQLHDIAEPARGAHFHCTIALVIPNDDGSLSEFLAQGDWYGSLAMERRGENGFGYDPIFLPNDAEVSAAELSPEHKNRISHRGLAFAELVPLLRTNVIPI